MMLGLMFSSFGKHRGIISAYKWLGRGWFDILSVRKIFQEGTGF